MGEIKLKESHEKMECADGVNLLGGNVNCKQKRKEAVIIATKMIQP